MVGEATSTADDRGAGTAPVVVAIDPGVRGAVAVLDAEAGELLTAWDLPRLPGASSIDVDRLLQRLSAWRDKTRRVWIEKAGYRPGDGGKATFTYGRAYGELRACCAAMGWAVFDVTPTEWQERMLRGVARPVESKDPTKAAAQTKAVDLWPGIVLAPEPPSTHVIDALLIAEWARLTQAVPA